MTSQKTPQPSESRIRVFHVLDTILRLIVIIIIIIATELTIHWNDIKDVSTPGTVGQLIPLVIGVGAVAHLGLSALKPRIKVFVIKRTATTAVTSLDLPVLYSAPVQTFTIRPSSYGEYPIATIAQTI
jgi:hypothetical protein